MGDVYRARDARLGRNVRPPRFARRSRGTWRHCGSLASALRARLRSRAMSRSVLLRERLSAPIGTLRATPVIFDITMCRAPSRATLNPAFSRARTARRCGTPESFATGQTETTTSRMFDCWSVSVTARYSRMLSRASTSVAPWDQQPGNPGQETEKPSSDSSKATL